MESLIQSGSFRAAASLVWLVVTQSAVAQIPFGTFDCLDLTVAESDAIVYGEIVSSPTTTPVDSAAPVIEVRVRDVFKGELAQKITVACPPPDDTQPLSLGVPVILFLKRGADRDSLACIQVTDGVGLPTMDLGETATTQGALKTIREAVQVPVERPLRKARVQYRANHNYLGTFASYINAPVDARLERLARQWLAEDKLESALQALSHFPSPENARLIEPLLRSNSCIPADGRLGPKRYTVREDAWEAVKSWGLLDRPIIYEPDDLYQRVGWIGWTVAVALLTGLAICLWRRCALRFMCCIMVALAGLVCFE